jgi:DNA-binding response OmpR family regulator/HPt (histidine-containing phosphotransfer) domain-containing protein
LSGNREEALDASIAALWEQARERALGRVDAVEEAVVALLSGPVEADLAERARREAHKLAGSLGTFGMPAGTEHARALELRLEAGARPADAPGLADHVTALRRIVEAGPAETVAPEPPPGPRDVAVMGLPGPRETEVLRALADRGVAAVAASEPGAAPVALVCGADLAARVERLAARGDRVAVIVPAGETDHVELVRRGALRLLPESLSSDAIADELLSLVAGGRRTEDRVLVVDDDPDVLARARDVLAAAGYGVATLDDPAGFWPALDRTRPDLVVLDVDLPGANGVDLCRALRADAQWAATPVLFLTATVAPEAIGGLFAAGGDDCVTKPFAGPELAARVGNRLDRTRLLRAATMTDPVTGLDLRGPAHARMRRFVRYADRLGQPVTVGLLRLEGLPTDVDAADAALSEAGRALRGVLGPDDVGTRWADDTLAIARLGGADPPPAALLDAVALELRDAGHAASSGVARYPNDGADLAAVLAAAEAAIAPPRDDAAAAPSRAPRHDADVVLVEDDDALAEVVAHALRTRGYRVHTIADGDEAAGALGGASPALRARVVLLDWDLPGRDGLTILRGLAADGVLAGTAVIMLTARASEREVVAALDLGAADHIAKPISLPVLMQKVRRAAGAPEAVR